MAETSQQTDAVHSKVEPSQSLVAEARETFGSSPRPEAGTEVGIEEKSLLPSIADAKSFAFHQHSYVTECIKFADQKAAFVFAASTGLLCYLFKSGLHKLWLKPPLTWSPGDLLCFTGMACLLIGLCFAAAVVVPRLHATHSGLVFFRSVTEFETAETYASEVLSSPEPLLTRSILKHTYDLSKVCSSKYAKLAIALWGTSIGVALSVFVLLVK